MNNIGSHRHDTFNVRLQLEKRSKKAAGIIRNPKLVHRKTGELCDPFSNVRGMHTKGDGLIIKETEYMHEKKSPNITVKLSHTHS